MSIRNPATLGTKNWAQKVRVRHCLAALFCCRHGGAMSAADNRSGRSAQTSQSSCSLTRHCCRKTVTFQTQLTLATTLASLSIFPFLRRVTSSCCRSCRRDSTLFWPCSSRMQSMPEQSPSPRLSHDLGWRRRHRSSNRKQFNDWASSGGQPGRNLRYPIPDYMLHTTGHFYSSVRHKGQNYAALYSTRIKNYNLRILVASNDQEFLRKSKHALAAAHFYCTLDDGTLTSVDGKPVKPEGDLYMGPTVPTSLANAGCQSQAGAGKHSPGRSKRRSVSQSRPGLAVRDSQGLGRFPSRSQRRSCHATPPPCANMNSCTPVPRRCCESRNLARAALPTKRQDPQSRCGRSTRLAW